MSKELEKDALDALCASDPHWASALQVLQFARKQSNNDPIHTSTALVCAIVLLASDMPNPQAILNWCADSLRKTPMKESP